MLTLEKFEEASEIVKKVTQEGRACPATLVISPAFFSFNISWRTNPGFVWTLSAIEALERDFSLLMAIRTIT